MFKVYELVEMIDTGLVALNNIKAGLVAMGTLLSWWGNRFTVYVSLPACSATVFETSVCNSVTTSAPTTMMIAITTKLMAIGAKAW